MKILLSLLLLLQIEFLQAKTSILTMSARFDSEYYEFCKDFVDSFNKESKEVKFKLIDMNLARAYEALKDNEIQANCARQSGISKVKPEYNFMLELKPILTSSKLLLLANDKKIVEAIKRKGNYEGFLAGVPMGALKVYKQVLGSKRYPVRSFKSGIMMLEKKRLDFLVVFPSKYLFEYIDSRPTKYYTLLTKINIDAVLVINKKSERYKASIEKTLELLKKKGALAKAFQEERTKAYMKASQKIKK